MIIDTVLVTTTLAIAALVSHALWKARRSESSHVRRVIGLALCGAVGIMLAKLVQLAILVSANGASASSLSIDYADIAATMVVAVGIALFAISLLDMIMIGQQLRPKDARTVAGRIASNGNVSETHVAPDTIPAILFRRVAPLADARISSVFLNNKPEDMLGFTREEMQSDPHFLTWLMHPEDRQDFLKGDDRIAAGESEAVFDHRFKHRNGSYRWIRTIVKRVDDKSGAFGEIVGCGLDITDLKESEEQLMSILSTDPCKVIAEDELI